MALTPKKQRQLPGGILLLILCLLSVVILSVWANEGTAGPLHQVKSGVETVVTPLRVAGSVVAAPLNAANNLSENVTTDSKTAEELRRQNEELQSQLIRMEEYRQENERLSKLLELKEAYNLESVGARVITTSTDSWNRVITINKGSIAGLSVGMPVMSANGLIGQIESVNPYSSVVRLIVDEESGVAAFLQSSRAEGVLSGSVDGILHLNFISLDVSVEPGDAVITSGAGGIYPKGIPLGEVITVETSPSDVYQRITVRPVTRVSAFEEVLVLVGSEAEIVASGTSAGGSGSGGTGASGSGSEEAASTSEEEQASGAAGADE
ncbi:MAG: rod shape-determining protein MreC [Coriobacteriales bacterium]|jgi:rod shape-determining protein MreC|nr:rod shape-determining protein MreC [Coriobacteriales bacterium]